MNDESPILRTVARFAIPVTVAVALRIYWQGHDQPGGGFVAGVMLAAAGATALLTFGIDWAARFPWWRVAVVGLAIAVTTGAVPLLRGWPYMDNGFLDWPIHLPTAAFFDLGVMLIVLGTLMTIFVELGLERR